MLKVLLYSLSALSVAFYCDAQPPNSLPPENPTRVIQPVNPPKVDDTDPQAVGRGRLFYAVVKDRVEDGLVKKGVSRTKARELTRSLSAETIDAQADQLKIAQGIGDGGFLDWLRNHREELLKLVEILITLLLLLAEKVTAFGWFAC